MQMNFELGNPTKPKGHALVYFHASNNLETYYATYIVVLPTSIDMAKYMPPFLAPQLSQIGSYEVSSFAFPPVPELVGNGISLQALALSRDDDLIQGEDIDPNQIERTLGVVNELVQEYSKAYADYNSTSTPNDEVQPKLSEPDLTVNQVLYEFMSDDDRLLELAKLTARLRFAVEGKECREIESTEAELALLGDHFPELFKINLLIQAIKTPTKHGGELAQLYLERCYKLSKEDYSELRRIDEQISVLLFGKETLDR